MRGWMIWQILQKSNMYLIGAPERENWENESDLTNIENFLCTRITLGAWDTSANEANEGTHTHVVHILAQKTKKNTYVTNIEYIK